MKLLARPAIRGGVALTLLALAACAGAPPLAPPGPTWGSTSTKLANGLEVVIVPLSNAPIVHMQLTYKVGSNDETPGKTGLAHYLEHLMFRAGEKANAGHLQQIAQAGGTSNAFTSEVTTSYYNAVPPDKLEETLKREAARIAAITRDEEAAKVELDVVKREKSQRGDSSGYKLYEKVAAALWPNHPYGRMVIGSDADLNGLTLEDARAFHTRWYGAGNLQIVLAGKVTREAAMDLVQRYLAPLPKTQAPPRAWTAAPLPKPATLDVEVKGADVGAPSLSLARVIADANVTIPKRRATLLLANLALTGSADARLTRPLVYGNPIASFVRFSASTNLNNSLSIGVDAAPLETSEFPKLKARILTELDAIRAKPLTEAELERIKKRYLTAFDTSRDKPGAAASAFSVAFYEGFSPSDVEAFPDTLRSVTLDEVNAALQQLLAPGPWLEARLLPKDSAKPEGPSKPDTKPKPKAKT